MVFHYSFHSWSFRFAGFLTPKGVLAQIFDDLLALWLFFGPDRTSRILHQTPHGPMASDPTADMFHQFDCPATPCGSGPMALLQGEFLT